MISHVSGVLLKSEVLASTAQARRGFLHRKCPGPSTCDCQTPLQVSEDGRHENVLAAEHLLINKAWHQGRRKMGSEHLDVLPHCHLRGRASGWHAAQAAYFASTCLKTSFELGIIAFLAKEGDNAKQWASTTKTAKSRQAERRAVLQWQAGDQSICKQCRECRMTGMLASPQKSARAHPRSEGARKVEENAMPFWRTRALNHVKAYV